MTDNNRNTSYQALRYRTPLVKVIEIKSQGVLCSSPELSGYRDGSHSDGGDMMEED